MAETLLTVRTEVLARGFEQLSPTRTNRLINDAYSWLVKKAFWPFRDTTATGAAPLTVANLGPIASVRDTANGNHWLDPLDQRTIEERYGDLTLTGTPAFFYVSAGVIKTYPVGGTLNVRHWKNATLLVADADPLIVPDEWVQIVIDRACYRAYLDDDNFQGAAALRGEIAETLVDMMNDLLLQQAAAPDQVEVYGGEGR